MMANIKTVEVNENQLLNMLSFKQCRISIPDVHKELDISTGDNIVFSYNGKTACAKVKESYWKHIQDVEYEEIYDEGIRTEVPSILTKEVNYPEDFDNWDENKQNTWISDLARATYIAQCKLAEDMVESYKTYWDSIVASMNFEKLSYIANPIVKIIRFDVM